MNRGQILCARPTLNAKQGPLIRLEADEASRPCTWLRWLHKAGVAVKFIHVSDAFHWPDFLPAFRKAAQVQGFAEEVLVDTAAGPLSAWTREGKGSNIYLSGGIHGDEPAGPLALLKLMEDGFFATDFCASGGWAICPALNPTGLAAGIRDTAQGVDLNRDYHLRKTPEVKAHTAWLERQTPPDLFLSLHEDYESTGFYLYEINQCDDEPKRTQAILKAVGEWFAPEPESVIDDHEVREPGWIFHAAEPDLPDGWPEAIFVAKQKKCILSFTFETPSRMALKHRVAAHCAAVKAAVNTQPWLQL